MLQRACVGTLILLMTALHAPLFAQEFRIESEVFLAKEKEPFSESLTLFTGTVVYDFMLTGQKEIAILDLRREKFVLLDVERQMSLTLTRDEVLQVLGALRAELQKKDPFLAEPRFDQSFDQDTDWLTLASDRMTYRVKGAKPEDETALPRWRKFADWSARLNATVPGTMPPFARLNLNQSLTKHGFLPEKVELTVHPKKRLLNSTVEVKSRHLIIWQLSRTDRERIDKANLYRATFKPVNFKQYRQVSEVAQQRAR